MSAPEGIQTAITYLINEHLKPKTMENKAISQDYSFTTLSHSQIISVMEDRRISKGISAHELSKKAGYSKTVYSRIANSTYRFTKESYLRFCDAINGKLLIPRNKEINIENESTFPETHKYKFSKSNHSDLITIFNRFRTDFNIGMEEFSEMAGYWKGHYSALCTRRHKFSNQSYMNYRKIVLEIEAKEKSEEKIVDFSKVTLEEAIAICKANGLRVAKSEVTTNWIEL
jgi:hypothetical protein